MTDRTSHVISVTLPPGRSFGHNEPSSQDAAESCQPIARSPQVSSKSARRRLSA
jgi:hypothetical protein